MALLRLKAGPTSKELNTPAEIEKFLSHQQHSIVGFFKSADSDLAKEFKKLADQLAESYRFGYTTSQELADKYKHADEIVIYQPPRLQVKLEPSEKVYSGAADSSAIKKFIEQNYHGLVGHRTTANDRQFKRPLVTVAYQLDYFKDAKGSNYVRNRIMKVAQKLRDEGLDVTFAVANHEELRGELYEFEFSEFNAEGRYVSARGKNDEKYKFSGEYT